MIYGRMQPGHARILRIFFHFKGHIAVQVGRLRLCIQTADFLYTVMIKRGIDNPVFHPGFSYDIQCLFLYIRIPEYPRLQFNIHLHRSRLHIFQHFSQCRDPDPAITFHPVVKRKSVKFLQSVVPDKSFSRAGPVDGFIMDHHDFPVFCQLYIKFDPVRLLLPGQFKCRHRIFRSISAGSSVRKYFCHDQYPSRQILKAAGSVRRLYLYGPL